MTDYKPIKVPKEDFERHKQRKQELGVSWAEYVEGQAPESRSELIEEIREQLERLDPEYEQPESDPVDYAEIERRVERAIEGTIR